MMPRERRGTTLVVAMIAASTPPEPQAAAAAMLLGACVGIVVRVCRRPRRRQPLRRCPLCAADAVATVEREVVGGLQVRVRQQCGQCGVWREVVTAFGVIRRYERTLEADRAQILHQAERSEAFHPIRATPMRRWRATLSTTRSQSRS